METQLQTQSAAVQDNNQPPPPPQLRCPRCDSSNTKFCYYNNYSLSQPRHFCKSCKRYWTRGGTLRNVPVGGGCRKNKRLKHHRPNSAAVPQLQQQNPSCHVIRPDGNITLNINSNSNSSSNNNSINPLLYGLPGNHAPPAHLGSDGLGYQGIISPSMATLLASTLNGNKFSSNGAVKAETAANLQFQALAGFEQGQDWNSVNNNNNNNNNLGWGQMIGDHNVNYLHHHHHQMEQIGSGQDWAGLWSDPGSSIGPSVTSLI